MWTTKEVFIISLATGLAFCLATIYSQRKIQQYIDHKVSEKSTNPLSGLLTREMTSIGQAGAMGSSKNTIANEYVGNQHRVSSSEDEVQMARPPKTQEFHEPPPGAGERWTPLAIGT